MTKINTKRKIIALLAIATLISIVNASIFVYYPITLTISPQEPPVIFEKGSNANAKDLWGKTILVNIGDDNTKLTITVHPTLQRNYYYDIAKIHNKDSNTYFVKFRVISPINDERVTSAYLIINGIKINLLENNELQPESWIELKGSEKLIVDLYVELAGYSGGDIEVSVDLIITTTQTVETPPTTPP